MDEPADLLRQARHLFEADAPAAALELLEQRARLVSTRTDLDGRWLAVLVRRATGAAGTLELAKELLVDFDGVTLHARAVLAEIQSYTVWWERSHMIDASVHTRRAAELFDAAGEPHAAATMWLRLADMRLSRGDLAEASTLLDHVDALPLGDRPLFGLETTRIRGVLHRLAGRWEEAEATLVASVDRADALGNVRYRVRCRQSLANVYAGTARVTAAARCLEEVADLLRPGGSPYLRFISQLELAELLRGAGRLEQAELAYDGAADIAEQLDGDDQRTLVRFNRVMLAVERNDWSTAGMHLDQLQEPSNEVLRGAAAVARAAWWAPTDALAAARELGRGQQILGRLGTFEHDVITLARAVVARGEPGLAVRGLALAARTQRRGGLEEAAAATLDVLAAHGRGGAPVPLGPFLLHEPLGRGGVGAVWRASHPTGAQAAVKVVHQGSDDVLEVELEATAALDHPHLARLLDSGLLSAEAACMRPELVAGRRWVATEFVPGSDLLACCGRLAWPHVLELLLKLLDGLAHAHARGLLHLDVKPANIVLREGRPDHPVLIDFGIARRIGEQAARREGTPMYMAPEQFRGVSRELGPWTDLYALGCVAVHLVTGRPPFEGTVEELWQAHTAKPLPELVPVVAVPRDLEAWCQRMAAKSPAERFRSAAEAAASLSSLGVACPTGSTGSTGARPSRRARQALTTLNLSDLLLTDEVPATSDGMIARPPAVFPRSWAVGAHPPTPLALVEAGLGVFGLRQLALVGRHAERDVLWAALQRAWEGESVVVTLEGAPGVGRRALARWLTQRAHELGVAPGIAVEVAQEADDVRRLLGLGGARLVVALGGLPPGIDATYSLVLGPLTDDLMDELLGQALPMEEDLVRALRARAAGYPARALSELADLLHRDRLALSADGWRLRPGAVLSRQGDIDA